MSQDGDPQRERLRSLVRIAQRETELLQGTAHRLFNGLPAVREENVTRWIGDDTLSERLDAFVARFARLQDTVGDKLIPALLAYLGEPLGPVVDNLDKAERFGWLDSAQDWMTYRKLRNQMVHEYIEDNALLADALEAGREYVPVLIEVARRVLAEVRSRL